MKVWTTYYGNLRSLPVDVVPISIAARAPSGYDGLEYRALIPPYGVFADYKAGGPWENYIDGYTRQVLNRLDAGTVMSELSALSEGSDIALICYEKPEDNCHRHLVAEWLSSNGFPAEEYPVKKRKRGKDTDNSSKVYVNARGERVFRITEIIRVLAKDQLILWANMLGFKGVDYKKELERTASIGTMVHSMIERYTTPGKLAVYNYEDFDIEEYGDRLEVTRAMQSFLKWYRDLSYEYHIKFTEKVVVGSRYGGTIDCGIDGFRDPDKVIFVDYKTSSGFYLSQFLQLAGYVRIYEELYGPNTVEGVMVVLCSKKGKKAEAKMIPRENMEILLLCFDTLYNVALTTRSLNGVWKRLCFNIE